MAFKTTHGVYFALPNPFLTPFLRLPIPKTWLRSIPLLPSSYAGRLASRNSTLHFRLLFSTSPIVGRVKVKVTLRLTVGQSVSNSIWGSWPDIYYCLAVSILFLWDVLSGERMGLSSVYAAGPCQRSLSWVRVPCDSRSYFTVSDLRLPFSSPPTTRRVTVEVFDPASTRARLLTVSIYNPSARAPRETQRVLLTRRVYRAVA
jgi:hypothetical protein